MEGKISIFHVTNVYFCVSQYVNYINILISQCLKGLMYIEMPFFFLLSYRDAFLCHTSEKVYKLTLFKVDPKCQSKHMSNPNKIIKMHKFN